MQAEEIFIWEKNERKTRQFRYSITIKTLNVMMTDKALKAMNEKYTDTCCPPRLIKSV